ncbi:hypothetical protein OIO90_001215 [Microbotryomycetes sp. JL221]|nr:hypothetical protein OIO90_001215 [Microbotryomycetes sp. JL221]
MSSTLPPLVQATAGGFASTMSNALVYPLDTVTTRMQTATRSKINKSTGKRGPATHGYDTVLKAIRTILRTEGWQSFYLGLGSDSLSTAISNFLYFYTYSFLHSRLAHHKQRKLGPVKTKEGKTLPPALTALEGLVVGMLSGIVAKGFVSPLSNITVRQQTASTTRSKQTTDEQDKDKDKDRATTTTADEVDSSDDEDGEYGSTPSIVEVARDIINEKGVWGLWSGFSSTIVLTLNPAITFYSFDLIKRAFIPAKNREHPTPLQSFLAGAFASSVASIITYPLILAKTRLQFKSPTGRRIYQSNIDVFRKTINKHGIKGMYQGLDGQLSKAFVSEGVKMMIKERFELLIVLLHKLVMQRRALQ